MRCTLTRHGLGEYPDRIVSDFPANVDALRVAFEACSVVAIST
jgi:hypothetical protein